MLLHLKNLNKMYITFYIIRYMSFAQYKIFLFTIKREMPKEKLFKLFEIIALIFSLIFSLNYILIKNTFY